MPLPILSIDLANSAYSANGVALLTSEGNTIHAEFITLPLTGVPDPKYLAKHLNDLATTHNCTLIILDGPQGWRDPAEDVSELRACERKLATPAKTGLPGQVKPANYRPYVEFCIKVFDALAELGWPRLPSGEALSEGHFAVESFPLAAWRTLKITSLPAKAKAKPDDITNRLAELQTLAPITTSRAPNHDELQALVAGLAGFPELFDIRIEGVEPKIIDGLWREGFIVAPKTKAPLHKQIATHFKIEDSKPRLFKIRENRWYAWQMIPGYGWGPYFSPIHVGMFKPLKSGKGLIEMGFLNAEYAEGVQGFFIRARVLKRTPEFILLDLGVNGAPDRAAIISEVSVGWLNKFVPQALNIPSMHDEELDVQKLLNKSYQIGPP